MKDRMHYIENWPIQDSVKTLILKGTLEDMILGLNIVYKQQPKLFDIIIKEKYLYHYNKIVSSAHQWEKIDVGSWKLTLGGIAFWQTL